jgi:predicted GNAT family N-acyltransferase
MEIIYELSDKHISQVHRLYQKEWWTNQRSLEETKACIAGSQICIAILDNNADVVAFSRVLTDYIFKALIFDVIVDSSLRGAGLGNLLLDAIKGHKQLNKVKAFELYCLPELQPFYRKHGFSTDVGGISLMKLSK